MFPKEGLSGAIATGDGTDPVLHQEVFEVDPVHFSFKKIPRGLLWGISAIF